MEEFKSTPFFKISKQKRYQAIDLKKQFGIIPSKIIIERMTSRNNVIRVVAVLPKKDMEVKK